MLTSFHGVGAYRGQRNPIALSRAISIALSGVEICTADRPIGAFGIVVMGEMTALFDADCWSDVDERGERYATGWANQVQTPADQLSYEEYVNSRAAEFGRNHYCESWTRATVLRAVWVKDWADEKTKRAARIIAKHRGVPLLTLKPESRISDVLDNNKLPFVVSA